MLWKYKVAKEFKIKLKADTLAVQGMKVAAWIFTCAGALGSSCHAVKDTIAMDWSYTCSPPLSVSICSWGISCLNPVDSAPTQCQGRIHTWSWVYSCTSKSFG
nr:uncharacterized protein LOC123494364 [Aegilops tauschii subsp. strangulata]